MSWHLTLVTRQWSAGTGCDAAPYFREYLIHREQIKKFDKAHVYIQRVDRRDLNELTLPSTHGGPSICQKQSY